MKLPSFNKITSIGLLSVLISFGFSSNFNIANSSEEKAKIEATGVISPASFKTNAMLNQTITLERDITVSVKDLVETIETSTGPDKLDILFLADNTDSMGLAISNVQQNATALLNNLSQTYDDLQIGIARYYGDPQEKKYSYRDTGVEESYKMSFTYLDKSKECLNGQGLSYICYKYEVVYTEGDKTTEWTQFVNEKRFQKYGDSFTKTWQANIKEKVEGELGAQNAYQLQTPMSSNLELAKNSIGQWTTSSGGNWKEGNFFALHQAATGGADINGYSTGYNTNWRNDAKKVIVWFGDAQSHTNTVSSVETIEALKAQDISVIAIHTKSTAKSQTEGLDANSQGSSIANATDGAFADVYSSKLSETIETLIGTTVTKTITTSPGINLNFSSEGDTEGLNIVYTCIDELGCDDVKNGQTRKFSMTVMANDAKTYSFKTVENVTDAKADNFITTFFAD